MSKNEITLRAPELLDVDKIYQIENQLQHWQVGENTFPYSKKQIIDFVTNGQSPLQTGQARFVISKGSSTIGFLDIYDLNALTGNCYIGIIVDDAYRGNGYAKESLLKIESYLKDILKVRNILAKVLSDNLASINLFSSVNYKKAGVIESWFQKGTEFVDMIIYQKRIDKNE